MIHTMLALDIVSKQGISKAIVLKFLILLPAIIRMKELVAVIDPCMFYAMPYGKVYGYFLKIFVRHPSATWMWQLGFVINNEIIVCILKIIPFGRHISYFPLSLSVTSCNNPVIDTFGCVFSFDVLFQQEALFIIIKASIRLCKHFGLVKMPYSKKDRELSFYIIKCIRRN